MLPQFFFDLLKFAARLIAHMLQLTGTPVPIPAVVQIAFDFVQDSVNPCGSRIVFGFLDNIVSAVPISSKSQFDRIN